MPRIKLIKFPYSASVGLYALGLLVSFQAKQYRTKDKPSYLGFKIQIQTTARFLVCQTLPVLQNPAHIFQMN